MLVQLNQAGSVLCRFVHESPFHDSTQLLAGQLRRILRTKDGGFCKDTPIPTTVRTCMSLGIEPEFSLKFSSNTRHHCRYPSLDSQFTWCCRFEMCRCCVLRCSQPQNEDTMREAEHVQAHTVETTSVQLEHHSRKGSQDVCKVDALQGKGVVLTPGTAQLGEDWCCDNIVDITVDSEI